MCTLLCEGSCPGSGMVMDSMVCQSLGSLLASGTEVALLNTALPHLSPNTPAHFKVNCFCGAASWPPRVTRLLPFVLEPLLLVAKGCVLECGGGWLVPCLVLTRGGTVIHMQRVSTRARGLMHMSRGKQNFLSNRPKKATNSPQLLLRRQCRPLPEPAFLRAVCDNLFV